MAVLIGLAGAGIGGALFGQASVGWLIGSIIGNILFPTKTNTEGPKLSDLSVTSSAWGASIPIAFGTIRMAGNTIWSPGLQQHASTSTVGGKGGVTSLLSGQQQSTTSYTYSLSWAVGFGEGPASDVLRIWFDGKLVYDKTNPKSHSAQLSKFFRFYKGDETQLPDPTIEADKGAGNVPAHRGLCYIVFKDVDVTSIGHMPSVTAEITFPGALANQVIVDQTQDASIAPGIRQSEMTLDWDAGYFFQQLAGTPGYDNSGAATTLLDPMAETHPVNGDYIGSAVSDPRISYGGYIYGDDGYLYSNADNSSLQGPLCKIDPLSMKEITRYGAVLGQTGPGPLRNGIVVGILTQQGLPQYYLFYDDIFGDKTVYDVSGGSIKFVYAKASSDGTAYWMMGPQPQLFQNKAYIINLNQDIFKFTVNQGAFGEEANPTTPTGMTYAKVGQYPDPTFLEPGTSATWGFDTGANTHFVYYDQTDDSLIICAHLSNTHVYLWKWNEITGVKWHVRDDSLNKMFQPALSQSSRLTDGYLATFGTSGLSNTIVQYDTNTGQKLSSDIWLGVGSLGSWSFDSQSGSIVYTDSVAPGTHRLYLGKGTGLPAILADIVTAICGKVDLTPDMIDVSQLTDQVPGFFIARQVAAKDALVPLGQAYFFDSTESDYFIKFPKRAGKSISATVTQDELVYIDTETDEFFKENRKQEFDLPVSVSIVFMDKTTDYQQGSKTKQRNRKPVHTMRSSNAISAALPLALDPNFAIQVAEKMLYTAWAERSNYEMHFPWTYLYLDAADLVTMQMNDGTQFLSIISQNNVGVNYEMALSTLSENAATFASTAPATTGTFPGQSLPGTAQTELFVFDLPLLRDVDDSGGLNSNIYLAASGFGDLKWPGCVIFKSPDGQIYNPYTPDFDEAIWGVCSEALPDNKDPWTWDNTTFLTIYLQGNPGGVGLSSVSDLEVLNGANVAAIMKRDGSQEVIQFVNATLNPTGSYTLSRLLRGRRGTDVFCAGHQQGELFVLLETATIKPNKIPLTDTNVARFWKGVGLNQVQELITPIQVTTHGNDLKPLMPAHLKAAVVSTDIVLTWVRRTRLGGWAMQDGIGEVPLAETTEAYEIDIMSGPGGSVKRTLSVSAATTKTYLNADIITDFGSIPATLTMNIFQMSSVVGRGLSREQTVTVN